MNQDIRIRRGSQATLPALRPFELGVTSDSKRLYMGNGVGNILLCSAFGIKKSVARITSDVILDYNSFAVFADTSANSITVTLPDASANQGLMFKIKKIHIRNLIFVKRFFASFLHGIVNKTFL